MVIAADEESMRNDPVAEMDSFRRGIVKTIWIVTIAIGKCTGSTDISLYCIFRRHEIICYYCKF